MSSLQWRLMERHARIDDALRRELRRRIPDPYLTIRLKKLKLAIKDRLATLLRKGKR